MKTEARRLTTQRVFDSGRGRCGKMDRTGVHRCRLSKGHSGEHKCGTALTVDVRKGPFCREVWQ